MKINIEEYTENEEPKKKYKPNSTFCFLSLCRLLALICTLFVILLILIFCKLYIKFVLLWLEKQDTRIIIATICCLFVLVSLPVSIGYIILVVASGYMFGMARGLMIVVFGANFGLLIAHNLLKVIGHHRSIYRSVCNTLYVCSYIVISTLICSFVGLLKMIWQLQLWE